MARLTKAGPRLRTYGNHVFSHGKFTVLRVFAQGRRWPGSDRVTSYRSFADRLEGGI